MQTHSYKHGAQKQLVVKKHVILTDINWGLHWNLKFTYPELKNIKYG